MKNPQKEHTSRSIDPSDQEIIDALRGAGIGAEIIPPEEARRYKAAFDKMEKEPAFRRLLERYKKLARKLT